MKQTSVRPVTVNNIGQTGNGLAYPKQTSTGGQTAAVRPGTPTYGLTAPGLTDEFFVSKTNN